MPSRSFPFSLKQLAVIFGVVGLGAAGISAVGGGDPAAPQGAERLTQSAAWNKSALEKPREERLAALPPPPPVAVSEPEPPADADAEAEREAAPPAAEDAPPIADAPTPAYTEAAPEPGSLKPPFRAELTAGLAPLLNYEISARDLENVKEAVRLVYKDDFTTARALMAKIADPAARKLVHWYVLRASGVESPYTEVMQFRRENPQWPSRAALDSSIEAGLLFRETNPQKVLAYFADKPPETGAGKAALGGALIQTGQAERGKALIREAWRRHLFDADIETRISNRFGEHITDADNKARLYWLLAKEPKKRAASIQKLRKALAEDAPPPEVVKKREKPAAAKPKTPSKGAKAAQNKAKAKSAKAKAEKPAPAPPPEPPRKKALALGAEAKRDASEILVRVKELRRKSQWREAWSLLRSVPKDAVGLLEGQDWWEERRIHVRHALNAGYPKTAFELAQNHGLLTGEALSEAEFLAGWIGMRFLGKTEAARGHFAVAAEAGGLPKDRARAHYWLGRAEEALGRDEQAAAAYAEAGKRHHTFYGQLARQALPGAAPIEFRDPHAPTAAEIKAFVESDIARAIAVAHKAELTTILPVFFFDLARASEDPAQMTLTAELSLRFAPLPSTVRFAKIALNRGFAVERYAFPLSLPAPEKQWRDKMVEASLLHALTRQESEFNPTIVSPAGARGLMQLMPATARMVAKNLDVKYEPKKLDDPAFNVMLGGAFLKQMVESHGGSYIMALAAYNAGPGRVRQWIGQFGDPRKSDVDPIDWIERIPFTETRDYVHKIMESLQLYRAKLDRDGARANLAEDVRRGRSAGERRASAE
ncbi:MAG: lytic transglycosylase domain-containing protein [Hyphomicrobiales bacterium]|nr:lytic transglycosylase domain-containing protein [Hyphomicrobiales bacterium]